MNGRTVTVKSGQHAKTILCIFCQQNQLNFPQFLTEENKDVPEIEWRLFRARFKLDGRSVVGSGRTKKKAEMAGSFSITIFCLGRALPRQKIDQASTIRRIFHLVRRTSRLGDFKHF